MDATITAASERYQNFDVMPVAGEWRARRSQHRAPDVDPWSGEVLVEIPLASRADVDDAYRAAAAFGGEKSSGIGRFGGHWAVDKFTTDHWISVQNQARTYPI